MPLQRIGEIEYPLVAPQPCDFNPKRLPTRTGHGLDEMMPYAPIVVQLYADRSASDCT